MISEAENIKKPDPVIFERALQRLQISSEKSIFIGDNPIADIQGACGAGMKTIWFYNTFFDPPDSEICPIHFKEYKNLPSCVSSIFNIE